MPDDQQGQRDLIEKAVKGYVMGLKGNHPSYLPKRRPLAPLTAQKPRPSPSGAGQGKWLSRSLYRSAEIEGAKIGLTCGRCGWSDRRPEVTVTSPERSKTVLFDQPEGGRLSGEQSLLLVRGTGPSRMIISGRSRCAMGRRWSGVGHRRARAGSAGGASSDGLQPGPTVAESVTCACIGPVCGGRVHRRGADI